MNPDELRALIAQGESLTVEFKSDQGPLPDADLIEAVVCLQKLAGRGLLTQQGTGRGTTYTRPGTDETNP